jgi:hypothetical protein
MESSEVLRRVALITTDVSEEYIAPIFKVTRIVKLRKTDSCHPVNGGAKILRNVVSYNSHMP